MTAILSCYAFATPAFWLAVLAAGSLGACLGVLAAALCRMGRD